MPAHPGRPHNLDRFDRTRQNLEAASTPLEVMGLEGTAARGYWSWWADTFEADWRFRGRRRRPPPDPINAMLSYGYTLLVSESVAACEIAGLDPDSGFLHSERWGRPSLALDLMEEFRPVIVDSIVRRLVTGGGVTGADFIDDPQRGCRMSDRARRAFLEAYERRLLTLSSDARSPGRRPYREIIRRSATAVATSLVDPARPYVSRRSRSNSARSSAPNPWPSLNEGRR
jgi:CRISPR-associated protein Cas1